MCSQQLEMCKNSWKIQLPSQYTYTTQLQQYWIGNNHTYMHLRMTQLISPIVLAVVVLMLALHPPLLRVTVNSYSVLALRPVILHGLVVHSAQSGDGGVQLTEVVMLIGSLGWVHCTLTVSHDLTVATTLVGARRSMENTVINHNCMLRKYSNNMYVIHTYVRIQCYVWLHR